MQVEDVFGCTTWLGSSVNLVVSRWQLCAVSSTLSKEQDRLTCVKGLFAGGGAGDSGAPVPGASFDVSFKNTPPASIVDSETLPPVALEITLA